jgi:hypothetical protein
MLCIVTPGWPGSPAGIAAMKADLDRLFDALGCVHFASFAMLPPRPGEPAPPHPTLMFELAVDEGIATELLLQLLVARGESLLWELYFAGVPARAAVVAQERAPLLAAWLAQHTSHASGGFVGARDRSVQQIRREHALYVRARTQAAMLDPRQRLEAATLTRELANWALAEPELAWARRPAPRSFWRAGGWRRIGRGALAAAAMVSFLLAVHVVHALLPCALASFWRWLAATGLALVLLAAAALTALLLTPLWLLLLSAVQGPWRAWLRLLGRWHAREHRLGVQDVPRAHRVHPSVQACESALSGLPNHIISLTEIRSPTAWHGGWLRLWLRLVTWAGRCIFVNGRLYKAEGVKYGHWHLLDGGRRLLFCSNYDGSFGGYLDEFIAGAAWGVNLFWRRTTLLKREPAASGQPGALHDRDFPATRFFARHGGCKYEQRFKAYARDSMLPHLYRYQAYRHSHGEIERATRLRDALFGRRNPVNDDAVARILES